MSDSYGGCCGGGGSGGGGGDLTKFPSSVRVRFLILSIFLTLIFLFLSFFPAIVLCALLEERRQALLHPLERLVLGVPVAY